MRLENSVRPVRRPAVSQVQAPVLRAAAPKVAVEPQGGGVTESLGDFFGGVKRILGSAVGVVQHVINPNRVFLNPDAPKLGDRGGLKVASYNIMLGGKRGVDNIANTLKQFDADVICLQEASKESTEALAKKLGMHSVYMGSHFHPRGKAILSRYPIEDAQQRSIPGDSFFSRAKAYWDHQETKGLKSIEPLQKRTILQATVKVGDRTVDILDNHLALGYAAGNTQQLDYLAKLSKELKAKGHTVVAAGDFNTNFALAKPGKADPKGTIDTVTDTAREFSDRYKWVVGNIDQADNKAAAQRLLGEMNNWWDAPKRTVIVDGKPMTPEAAHAELKSGKVEVGSARYKQLLNAMDGSSIVTAYKRFDNIFTSKDARIASATVDQTSKSSDHQPVAAEIRWD